MAQSSWVSLDDAFDDCVDRLHTGQSVADCVRAYPQHAQALRALLETALVVRRASPAVPEGARARVRSQVMAAVLQAHPRRTAFSWQVRAVMAASVVIVLLVAVLFSQLNENTGHPLTVIPIPASSATLTLTPSLTSTPSLTPTATPTLTVAVSPEPTGTPAPTPTAFATPSLVCLFTIQESSVNLRSGPGIGYGVAAYAFGDDQFSVVATHTSGQWLKVVVDGAEVWVSVTVGVLTGDCARLPVSSLALQDGSSGTGDQGGGSAEVTSEPGGTADDDGGDTIIDDGGGDGGGDDSGDSSGDSGKDGDSSDGGGDDSGDDS